MVRSSPRAGVMSETCTICSEGLSADLCATPCGHVFHHPCIVQWMRQKPECPICKSPCASQLLTTLQYHPKQLLLDLQQRHQQQHTHAASASSSSSPPPSAPSSSPFELSLRVQSLRSQLEAARLLRTQRTDALTSLHSRLTDLTGCLGPLHTEQAELTASLAHLSSDLDRLRASLTSDTQKTQLMQRRRRTLLRQLLVLRCVGPVRDAWKEGTHVDLDALLRLEERRLPRSTKGEEEAAAREEAMELLTRVMIGEVQGQVESVKRVYEEQVQDKRRETAEAKRVEERCEADAERLLDERRRLIEQRAAIERRRQAMWRKRVGESKEAQHVLASALSEPLVKVKVHTSGITVDEAVAADYASAK